MTAPRYDGAPWRIDVPATLTIKAEGDEGEEWMVSGLAAAFGNRDHAGDIINPEAFDDFLAAPRTVPMLWQHDWHQPIGTWPGANFKRTETGLAVKGPLVPSVQKAREARDLIRAGALTGLSIGFNVPPNATVYIDNTCYINKIDLVEISLVTFPCNDLARVTRALGGMKIEDLTSKRALEAFLREKGLSQSEARFVASRYSPADRDDSGAHEPSPEITSALAELHKTLRAGPNARAKS